MTILELLAKMVGPADQLIKLLNRAALAAPDLAPQVEIWIAKLNTAVAADNLIALAEALPKEIANIAGGRIDPRAHPSDSA